MNIQKAIDKLDELSETQYRYHEVDFEMLREILLSLQEPEDDINYHAIVTATNRRVDAIEDRLARLEEDIIKLIKAINETNSVIGYNSTHITPYKPEPSSVSECKHEFNAESNVIKGQAMCGKCGMHKPKPTTTPEKYKPMHTYPNGWVKPSVEKCEHEWYIKDHKTCWCKKCGAKNDYYAEGKPKYNCVVCPECGLIGNWCEDETRISISRKVAEKALKHWNPTMEYLVEDVKNLADELHRALSKEVKDDLA
jgi:hypothetical protein